ncbi:MAG: pyridoxal-phosphate dependent enzyme, partial [Rhodobiaceae bacterium]
MTDFDYERIADARKALAGRVIRTPVMPLCSSKIAPYIPDNAELFIKLELFQHTGSFKARGSCLGIDWLDDAQRQRGVAGFSGGNFALALAWAAQSADVPAKVVMSKTADPYRIQGCRELGAEVVLVDGIAAALPMLETIEAEEGRRILHPFNDMNMAYGAATCGAEMVEDMPPLDMVVVPVGGGGLIAGMAAAIRKMSPDTLIIGVEPEG